MAEASRAEVSKILIRGGTVLALDRAVGDFERGDVLVEGETIAAVGPELEAPAGAELIDASRAIVMPYFVDTHHHTWQAPLRTIACNWTLGQYMTGLHAGLSGHFRPEDTYAGNLLGTVESLASGITTLLNWSHNLARPSTPTPRSRAWSSRVPAPSSPTVAAPRSGTSSPTTCRIQRTRGGSATGTSPATAAG